MLSHSANPAPIVAGLGEVLWDILPSGPRLGGAPANFAAHAASLGANAFVVSSVGSDELGERAAAQLERQSIQTTHLSRVDAPTGTVHVELTDGQPTYSITDNVAWDWCPWNPDLGSFADTIDAVCFGTLFQRSRESRNTLEQFLAATRANCLRIFDVNLRQNFFSDEVIAASLRSANVLKLNDEELSFVAKAVGVSCQRDAFAKSMMENFELQMLILTEGEKGSFLFTSDDSSYCKAEQVNVIDAVGAGDAFTAAIVMGLLGGKSLAELHESASKVAAAACCVAGAMPEPPL